MPARRHMNRLVRLVLGWFLLSLSVAMAAPALRAPTVEIICVGGSAKLLVHDDGGGATGATPHCPMCLAMDGPPRACVAAPAPPVPAGRALHPVATAYVARLTVPALPARGPPLASDRV